MNAMIKGAAFYGRIVKTALSLGNVEQGARQEIDAASDDDRQDLREYLESQELQEGAVTVYCILGEIARFPTIDRRSPGQLCEYIFDRARSLHHAPARLHHEHALRFQLEVAGRRYSGSLELIAELLCQGDVGVAIHE